MKRCSILTGDKKGLLIMPIVRLGNHAALDNGRVLEGFRVTTIPVPDDDSHSDRMRNITHADGLWPRVSAAPPAWVECNDAELEKALAEHFGCPVGQPETE